MLDHQVRLLHVLRARAGDRDGDVGHLPERAARPDQDDRAHADALRRTHGMDDVGRVPARADADQQIFGLAEGLDLAGEDAVVAAIVGISGQERRIGGQGEGGQAGAHEIDCQAARQLRRHVLAIRGAAAVPAQQRLTARAEHLGQRIRRRQNSVAAGIDELARHPRALRDMRPHPLARPITLKRHLPLPPSALRVLSCVRHLGMCHPWWGAAPPMSSDTTPAAATVVRGEAAPSRDGTPRPGPRCARPVRLEPVQRPVLGTCDAPS